MCKYTSILLVFILLFNLGINAQNKKKTESSNSGATIEKNLEAYTLLERAQVFLESKKYQDAVLLLKVIAEKYPNALITSEDKFYIPFREKIFEIISNLPAEAKDLFLVEINYISLGLYKKALEEMNEPLFEEIYQKYYLSELGDEVANQLGVIAFEKGNYFKSLNYFEKALAHPKCSLNKEKIKLSLYYLYKITKNENKAQLLFSQLSENANHKSIMLKTDQAISELIKLAKNSMIDQAEFIPNNKEFWTTVWQQEFELVFKTNNNGYYPNQRVNRRVVIRNGPGIVDGENLFDEEALIGEWKKNFWYPTNNSVVADNRVVFRKNDLLTCFALDNQKKVLWEANIEGTSKNVNQSVYYNEGNYGNSEIRIPSSRDEVLAFSDQIGKQMQIRKGVLYAISNHERTGAIIPYNQRRWGGNNGNIKYEGNMIFAIDIKSGKKLWKRGSSEKNDPFCNAIFLHLPIETPYGLYVTYQLNGDIYGATFLKQNEIIWNKYLCSAESSYDMPTNNAASVYGDDFVFITIDYGVVIKVNASNGDYIWIKRYNTLVESQTDYYNLPTLKSGHETNELLYQMGNLIVIPSDMTSIFYLDSDRGKELFKIEDSFAEMRRYLIGADETGYYMAGSKGIRKYGYSSDKVLWQSEIKENYGKAYISGKNILFPSNRSLYVIDKESGKKISMLNVKLDKQQSPLGNITSGNGFIISTNYNSISLINEVDLIISNLTESISKSKSHELLHQRGVLFFEIGEFKKSFDDISEAITLGGSNVEKNVIYCESLLDLFEKIHAAGEGKKFQASILEMSKYFTDSNHKSFLNFLEGEINVENKKYPEALKSYIFSLSQVNSSTKYRAIKSETGSTSSTFASLLKIDSLLKQKLITEESIIQNFEASNIVPEEFMIISMMEKINKVSIKSWLFKSYLKKCNNDFVSSKMKSFLFCLTNSEDPIVSLSAKYYLFLQNIQMKEYYSAGTALEILKKQKPEAMIFTENGLELLVNKLGQYKSNINVLMKDLRNPAIREITDPPLKEIWSTSKKIGQGTSIVKSGGVSVRPEFMEKNIYILSRPENKIFGCDMLTGEKSWTYELPASKNANRNIDYGVSLEFFLRMEGIGLLSMDQKEYAIDLKTGKNLWSLATEKSDSLDMGSGCLLRYKSKELTIVDALNGKKMYSLNLADEPKKALIYNGRLIVFNLGATIVSIYNLYTGEKVKDLTFDNSLRDNFVLFLGENLVLQKIGGQLISYAVKSGELVWQNNFKDTYLHNNYLFNINDKNILMYTQDGVVYYISGADGSIVWKYEVPQKFLYRTMDLCPISGNETFLLIGSSQVKQNKGISTAQDFYFIFDMAKGTLLNKLVVDLSQQDFWRQKFARNLAFKGEVVPKITVSNNNSLLINFVRKRDGEVVKKHFIDLKSFNDYDMVTVKGNVFFVDTRSEVILFSNPEMISEQNQIIKLLAEAFNEK